MAVSRLFAMSIKGIGVMLTGGIAGEGVAKGFCYVQFWCYFVIIYSEMVDCCWRFFPCYFRDEIPHLLQRSSRVNFGNKRLPWLSARWSDGSSAFKVCFCCALVMCVMIRVKNKGWIKMHACLVNVCCRTDHLQCVAVLMEKMELLLKR